MKKYLKVMLVLVVALSMLCTFALAANPFKDNVSVGNGGAVGTAVSKIGGDIIGIIQTIGYVVAVAMVLVVGIQWLMGTPAKKQELKGRMVNIVIGAVLIVAGVSLLGLVSNFAGEVETAVGGTSTGETETGDVQ